MLIFLAIFSIILLISLLLSGLLYFLDRHSSPSDKTRAPVHPSIFEFFTTLYAVFLGFALFTLWSAYINTERNITKEANTLFNAYHNSILLSNSREFRQALHEYVALIVAEEWDKMADGTMSPAADKKFDLMVEQLERQNFDNDHKRNIHSHIISLLEEAGSLRQARGSSLKGNLYRPIWVIIIFGVFTILFGIYSLHVRPNAALFIFNCGLLFLLLSCIYVIYDIDQPFSGQIIASPAAFQNILEKMQSLP